MPDAAANSCPDLPATPPVADLQTRAVLTYCLAAHAALAELRPTAQRLSTPAMAAAMTRLQAQDPAAIASSQAPPRRAAPSQGRREDHPGSDEAACYRGGLLQGVLLRNLRRLGAAPRSVGLAVAIAEAVTTPPSRCGRSGPPSAAGATLALAAWELSLKLLSHLGPLVGMALQHHHLLGRQPFAWASGPTGRIVDLLALLKDGLINAPNLNLRGYLWRSPGGYDRLLPGLTTCGDWQPWLLCMLRATELAAAWSSETIPTIRAVLEATAAQVRAAAPKHFSTELLELIFLEPCCRIGDLVARGPSERHHASCVFKELVRLGILREERCWRAKIFVDRNYLDLLASDEPAFGPDPRRVARVASRRQAKAQAA